MWLRLLIAPAPVPLKMSLKAAWTFGLGAADVAARAAPLESDAGGTFVGQNRVLTEAAAPDDEIRGGERVEPSGQTDVIGCLHQGDGGRIAVGQGTQGLHLGCGQHDYS